LFTKSSGCNHDVPPTVTGGNSAAPAEPAQPVNTSTKMNRLIILDIPILLDDYVARWVRWTLNLATALSLEQWMACQV
jgi:hypothetical protein